MLAKPMAAFPTSELNMYKAWQFIFLDVGKCQRSIGNKT